MNQDLNPGSLASEPRLYSNSMRPHSVIVPHSKIRHRDTNHTETTVSTGAKDTHSDCELSHPYDRYCRNPGDNNWLCYEGMLRIPLPPLKWFERENHLIHVTLIFSMASLSMGFSRQEYWSGLGVFPTQEANRSLMSPALAGWFFVISPPGKPLSMIRMSQFSESYFYVEQMN